MAVCGDFFEALHLDEFDFVVLAALKGGDADSHDALEFIGELIALGDGLIIGDHFVERLGIEGLLA